MPLTVVPVHAAHEPAWRGMYADYCASGGIAAPASQVDTVWAWLHDPSRQTRCLIAEHAGTPVGFVHVRSFERPITATTGLWVDDLYVTPDSRGHGIAGALLDAVRAVAAREGHDVVRWTTRETNDAARRLYDRVATRAPVVVYNASPTP